ncbi:P-loop containing nucleoside triphosphate hydrolase protein [Hesseltinella vesiculosa]|uniref:P-loop containing nucleoside triphosphate hydrolase protein n=1 Tax=Hesseltinella vesiculosa TaxID=101127 RepID=A0A1X2GYF1_9FUNG|nr:P-loop containing nucleoside triphosphate hydrolase protein [Hesseltinella vesiculosa]
MTKEKIAIEKEPLASDASSTTKDKKKKKKEPSLMPHQLFRYANFQDALLIAAAMFCSIAVGALTPVSIIVFGRYLGTMTTTLSAAATGDDLINAVLPTIYIIFYLAAALVVTSYAAQTLWILSGERQARRIRRMYLHAILRQDMVWFDEAKDGSLTTRLATDTQLIQDGISDKFGLLVQSMSQFITGLVVGFTANWIMAFVILATYPILGVTGSIMGIVVSKSTTKAQDAYADAGKVAEQAFAGIRTLYAFGLEERFVARYEKQLARARQAGIYRAVSTGLSTGIFFAVLFGTYALAFWYGAQLITQGRAPGYQVIVAFFGIITGAVGIVTLPQNLSAITGGCGAAYKVFRTIERVPAIDTDSQDGQTLEADWQPSVSLQDITFAYPTRSDITVLDNFSLNIEAGTTTALVGASGSGKSTVMQLLLRYYDPSHGQIMLGGKEIKSMPTAYVRSLFGYVGQEPVLFNLSIKQNILLGVDDPAKVTMDQVEDVCKLAYCHDFILQLPEGYNTIVGEGATLLSGGQKQRIAIARAILKNPKILLLDEATSALDTQSERLVQRALDQATKDRTTIVIAHRLSTIRNADKIVVMKQGKIVEAGSHNDLLAHDGMYSELVNKQQIVQGTSSSDESDDANGAPTPEAAATDDLTNKLDQAGFDALINKEKEQVVLDLEEQAHYEQKLKQKDRRGSSGSGLDGIEKARRDQEQKKKTVKKQSAPILRVIQQMRPEWPLMAVGIVGSILMGCVFPTFGYVFGRAVVLITTPDADLVPGPVQGANLYAFLMTMIAIACLIGITLKLIGFEMAGEIYAKRLRSDVFRAYLRQEVGFYDDQANTSGAMTTRLAVDSKNVDEMITKTWGELVQLVFIGISALVLAFVLCWQISLIILGLSPFLVAGGLFETKIEQGFGGSEKKANEESGQVAAEAIKEIRTVASLNKQAYFEARYYKTTDHPHRLAVRKAYTSSFGYACILGIPLFAQGIAFYAGLRFIAKGWITYTDMFTSLIVLMMGAQGVGQSMVFQKAFSKGKMSAIDVFDLIDRRVKIDPDLEGIEPTYDAIQGDIALKDIEFAYPTRPTVPIFKGQMNLHGQPLTKIALVGPSGCGKSTIIAMLERFYDTSSGSVRLDDHDVKKYTLSNLRKHLSMVQQEPIVFDLSIGDNIRYGFDGPLTQEQIEDAARLANIYDFIVDLPEKFDTRVGDKGSQLSGGQKQRIAIARALVRRPKILLLDEATSALDSESEKLVQEALDKVLEQGGRTTITIAHRLSTIQNSDLICVVSGGQIKEQGTHQELLALNGIYTEMVTQQSLTVT